jgi:integrase
VFASATGLRPEEWAALERRDVDRATGVLHVARTVTGGKTKEVPLEIVTLAKTNASRRQVPLSQRALAALDAVPARLDTRLIFAAPEGGPLRLDNRRRREWSPAVKAAGIAEPARPYDTRSTFITDALAAGVPIFTIGQDRGDVRAHDRARLRDAARRRRNWDRRPARRARRGSRCPGRRGRR